MHNITITITCGNATHRASYQSDKPEYMIADEAYCLAMTFAKTRVIAEYGRPLPAHQFAEFLQGLDYDYIIADPS